jgi:hypothetical protein
MNGRNSAKTNFLLIICILCYFKLEKVLERTIYDIIQRAENNITAKRKHGSGRIVVMRSINLLI